MASQGRRGLIYILPAPASCNPWQRTTLCEGLGWEKARLSRPGGWHSPPSLALAGQHSNGHRPGPGARPTGSRRAEARCPLRSAGRGVPGIRRLGTGIVTFSRHVPAGELGVLPLLGAGRSVRPGEKRSGVGAWGRRRAPWGPRRI